jgi:DNA-binding MarR family transcriptional regulator
MTKQGLVTKKKAGIDKRKYEVVITDKGKELDAKMTRDSIKIIFAGLPEEDKKRLHSYLSLLGKEAYKVLRRNLTPGITANSPAPVNRTQRWNYR